MPDITPEQVDIGALLRWDEQFRRVSRQLEPDHIGEALAIEPESGDYFVGESFAEALAHAKQQYPGKVFYTGRIGPFIPEEGYRHHPSTITMQDIYDPRLHRKRPHQQA